MENQDTQLVAVDDGNTQVVRPMCTCCETPIPLVMPPEGNSPFAFCMQGHKIYELQEVGGYAITNYVLKGKHQIVDPDTDRVIFPKDELPAQEELLQRARENSGGSKPTESGDPGRVNLGDAEYW